MKVFDLSCLKNHRFEGWFQSAADYDDQHARGLLICPNCADANIRKLLSAPRLNLSGGTGAVAIASEVVSGAQPQERAGNAPALPSAAKTNSHPNIEQMQALWYRVAEEIVRNTEDVGADFAEQARKIHYREAPERAIRGRATPEQAAQLVDEGIELFSMPLPESMKNPLQ